MSSNNPPNSNGRSGKEMEKYARDIIKGQEATNPANETWRAVYYGTTAWNVVVAPEKQTAVVVEGLTQVGNCLSRNGHTRLAETCSKLTTVLNNNKRIIPVAIVASQLTWEAIKNIHAWWKGHISGKRCAKNIIDEVLTVAGGIGTGAAGAAVGSLAGPVGTIVGAIIGGVLGSVLASEISKALTEKIFDLPTSVALENAYRYFGLTHSCSNAEINSAYRKMALRVHPDKGGSQEQFIELQVNLEIIKTAQDDL